MTERRLMQNDRNIIDNACSHPDPVSYTHLASVQAIFFGSVLTSSGNWNLVFTCIIGVMVVLIIAAIIAGSGGKKKA